MNAVITSAPRLPAMAPEAIDRVRCLENATLGLPQEDIPTAHLLHAGMYARTIRIPAGVVLTGALIKLPTVLIVSGDCTVFIGEDEPMRLSGYHVLPASAGRKQAFLAHLDTDLTMLFPSRAQTVDEAEAEFTDENHLLLSRKQGNESITITGE